MLKERTVAFLLPSMAMGGVSKMLFDILRELKDTDYKVVILLLNKEGEMLEQLPSWVTVKHVIGSKNLEKIRKNISDALNKFCFKQLFHTIKKYYHRYGYLLINKKDILEKEYYDVLVSFQDGVATWYGARHVQGKFRLAVVHTDFEQAQYDVSIERKVYSSFDYIYCTSKSARESFLRCLPEFTERTKIILPKIDGRSICKKAAISNGPKLSLSGLKLVTVARLSHMKGIDMALNVLAKLLADGYEVNWYFVGDGVERDKLETMAIKLGCEKNAIFMGNMSNPYSVMAAADIYVQPSKYESYCITLAEARALGCAIITTDFPSAHEQLIHGGGIIADTTIDSLFCCIKLLIEEPEERRKLALQNQELFCKEVYSENCLIQDIKEFCKGD